MPKRRGKRWKALTIFVVGFVVPTEAAWHYLPPYLIAHSHHALSPKDAFLPVVLIAGALLVGLLLGLWMGTKAER